MNELILQYYKIQVVGLIKLTQNVYKLKTNDGYYVAKCVEDKHIETIYEYIETLHIHCFVQILLNKNNELLTPYQNNYLYLMPYVDNNQGLLKEMKIKYYFETLAYLHYNSFYFTKVNQQYSQNSESSVHNKQFVH